MFVVLLSVWSPDVGDIPVCIWCLHVCGISLFDEYVYSWDMGLVIL